MHPHNRQRPLCKLTETTNGLSQFEKTVQQPTAKHFENKAITTGTYKTRHTKQQSKTPMIQANQNKSKKEVQSWKHEIQPLRHMQNNTHFNRKSIPVEHSAKP